MSTLNNLDKLHYFGPPQGISQRWTDLFKLMPILVIAFTVESTFAFEGKSDFLRQALRQERLEKLIHKIREDLRISGDIKEEFIFPDIPKNLPTEDHYKLVYEASRHWQSDNRDKKILFALYIGAAFFPGIDPEGEKKISLEDESFNPSFVVVFFSEK